MTQDHDPVGVNRISTAWESYDEKLDDLLRRGENLRDNQLEIMKLVERMGIELQQVLKQRVPTKIGLKLPTRAVKGKIMPNFELPNDEIVTIPIETTNQAGVVEPVPSGDVFSVASSSASLGVAIGVVPAGAPGAGGPAIVLTPLVQASPGITVTVTDSAGLQQWVQIVDIVPDVTDTNIVLDVANATSVAQPVPTAPGP